MKDGTPCLDQNAIDYEAQKWKTAIILYVIGDSPSFNYLSTYIDKQWNVAKPEIDYHKEDYFVIRFSSMEDRNRVLYSGPYTIANKLAIVRAWEVDFELQKEFLKVLPLWIQL